MMKVGTKFFVIVIIVVAVFMTAAAIFLMRENDSNKYVQTSASDDEYTAELVMRHLLYDGQLLNKGVAFNYYDKKGKLKKKDVPLDSIVLGNKCLALFSSNNCSSCVQAEMATLKNLPCRNEIIYIHDNAKAYVSRDKVPANGIYEVSKGKLCDAIEEEPETPILLYTEEARIVTSCVVGPSTKAYTRKFHDFINNKLSK